MVAILSQPPCLAHEILHAIVNIYVPTHITVLIPQLGLQPSGIHGTTVNKQTPACMQILNKLTLSLPLNHPGFKQMISQLA